MKKAILALMAIGWVVLTSCGSDADTTQNENVTVSQCQSDTPNRTSALGSAINNTSTYIEYRYENNTLWLTHYNAAFNCDERGIGATASINGNQITIKEEQNLPQDGGMNCLCLYDITIKVENVEAQSYILHYNEMLAELVFDINLSQQQEGIESFIHAFYPYNKVAPPLPSIRTIIEDISYQASLFPKQESTLVGSDSQMQTLIANLRSLESDKSDEWADILDRVSIDYDKESLLIYTFTAVCIHQYQHSIGMSSDQKDVSVKLESTRDECEEAVIQHYLAYRISKEIESVTVQAFEDDDVVIKIK